MFFSSILLLAEICSAFFQAKTSAEIMTQAITAIARSHVMTVIHVTAIITKASLFGILLSILSVGQAKVPITTINISQTKAASGIIRIRLVPNTTKRMRKREAAIHESLFLHQLDILIID